MKTEPRALARAISRSAQRPGGMQNCRHSEWRIDPRHLAAQCAVIFSCALFPGLTSLAANEPTPAPRSLPVEITPEHRTAVERGLAWLAGKQAEDGSYGSLSHYGPHVGITGLAGLRSARP